MRRWHLLLLLAAATTAAALAPGCKRDGKPARSTATLLIHPNVRNRLPARSVVKRLKVQIAYNVDDGVLYGHLSWKAPRGERDAFWRFEDGAWALRGTPARQAVRPADVVSAEARVTLAWTGLQNTSGAFQNFGLLGCALACHDASTAMPDHVEDGLDTRVTMHVPPGVPYYDGGGLDLWHWRAQTTNGNGYWSDEVLDDTEPGSGDAMRWDPGAGGETTNDLVAGHPSFVYDPATAGGAFAVPSAELAGSPYFFFEDPAAASPIAGLNTPKTLDWASAVGAGYVPHEGDTVPYWILADRTGGRGNVLAVLSSDGGATAGLRSRYDAAAGCWDVYFSRVLNTGNPGSDLPLPVDGAAHLAFAVHTDGTADRDHYVSLPFQVWMEDPGSVFGPPFGTDYTVRQIAGAGTIPDFSDTGFYPEWTVDLFLPGVLSFEYLTRTRTANWVFAPEHGGWPDIFSATTGEAFLGCRDCHVVRKDDPNAGNPGIIGGPLELRTPRRGGLFEATPASLSVTVQPVFDARCTPCHAPGGSASGVPLSGVAASEVYDTLLDGKRITWKNPLASPLVRIPAEDRDGRHPPAGGLAGFADSDDQRKIEAWILFNGPNN